MCRPPIFRRSFRSCWLFADFMERETGIEPATNGLGSRYSTIELLPLRRKLYPARPVSRV